jgi:hypothetical protein
VAHVEETGKSAVEGLERLGEVLEARAVDLPGNSTVNRGMREIDNMSTMKMWRSSNLRNLSSKRRRRNRTSKRFSGRKPSSPPYCDHHCIKSTLVYLFLNSHYYSP